MATATERLAILITAQGAQATGEVQKLTGAFGKLNVASLAAGTAVFGFGRFMFDAAEATSALREQVSASNAIFGAGAASLQEFAKGAADIGLSERAALQGANAIGGLFKQAGLGQEAAAGMSENMVKLSSDLASFRDVAGGAPEVLEKLRSGLTGEVEPLRNVGVFLNDAQVRAKAVELGFARTHAEVDDGAKILARYALIMEQTTDAQGDAAATAGSLANQQRNAAAEMENAQAKLGESTIQLRTNIVRLAADASKALRDMGDDSTTLGKIVEAGTKAFSPWAAREKQQAEERSKQAKKQADSDALRKKAQDDYAASLESLANQQRAFQESEEALTRQREESTKATINRRNAEEGLADARRSVDAANRSARDAEEDLAELMQRGAVDADEVARAKERVADAAKDVTGALEDEARAAKEVGSAQRDVADALAEVERVKKGATARELEEAELDLAKARRDNQRALRDQKKAQDEASGANQIGIVTDEKKIKTADELAEAQLDLQDANDRVKESVWKVRDAEKALEDTRNKGKPGSKDLQDALDVLTAKQETLAEKVQAQADAHEHVAERQRDQIKAGDELAKAEEGDPEFADKVADARQKVADAHENTARAKRNERDATEELQRAMEEFEKKVTAVSQQGVGTPLVATRAVGDQDFRPVVRNTPGAVNGGGGNTFVTVVTGADPNAVVRATEQYAARNGGSPRR